MLTIATFARLSGVSAKALRAYDGAGLFAPAWVDRSTGYRYYSPAQLPAIRRIVGLRQLGMGLDEIRALVEGGDVRGALERRRAELRHELEETERRLAALGIHVSMARDGDAAPDVVVRLVPEECVATLSLALAGGDAEAGFDELHAVVRDLRAQANRPPGALEDAGSVRLYVPITRAIEPTDRIGCDVLPAIEAASILHRGPYATISNAWRALERWIGVSGRVAGGPRRIVYLQFGADPGLRVPPAYTVEAAADYVTELQIPLR